MGNIWVATITFFFAYVFGYGMTLGPLLQDGVSINKALIDTFYSDTKRTITVMEITAISLDLWLAASASMGQVLFWILIDPVPDSRADSGLSGQRVAIQIWYKEWYGRSA